MTLSERLREYIEACFTAIWIESHEHADALAEIGQLCQRQDPPWRLATWDIEAGLTVARSQAAGDGAGQDPLAAIRSINALASADGTAILVLQNFHRLMSSAEVVQAMSRQILQGKQNRTFLIVLSPVVQIPVELEKLFVVVEHELPSREQLTEIARGVATEPNELPAGAELDKVLDAAAGLTRYEAENAFSLSLVRQQRIAPDSLWELKSQMLKKSGLVQLYRGSEDFSSLGGLDALKAFARRALLQPSRGNPLKRARGLLLLSPPGCGKSQFCRCLGKETDRPVLQLDVGSLMGSLVGQTEERTRHVLRIADAMQPCILMIDELEKAFAGVTGGQGDSGVSSRMFGSFLTWLNDHDSDVFVVCTSNDVSRLPPEFSRAERFDAVFFVDLPTAAEKDSIWHLYRQQYDIGPSEKRPSDTDWTGAEIKSACRLAALLDMSLGEAARNVVPVAVTAAESIDRLRTWASGRCLSASQPGIYQKNASAGPRRRVSRGPSDPSMN